MTSRIVLYPRPTESRRSDALAVHEPNPFCGVLFLSWENSER